MTLFSCSKISFNEILGFGGVKGLFWSDDAGYDVLSGWFGEHSSFIFTPSSSKVWKTDS